MPEAMERKLKQTARKRGYGKERTGKYVYGTLRKTGWKPDKVLGETKKVKRA